MPVMMVARPRAHLARAHHLFAAPHLRLVGALLVALMGDGMSPRQEALISSFAGAHQRVLFLSPLLPDADNIIDRLMSEVYVKVMSLDDLLLEL